MKLLITAILGVIFLQSFSVAQQSTRMKIGTFDSRAIAIAYTRSAQFMEKMTTFKKDYKAAKEAKDTLKVKELEEYIQLQQRILHNQGFGTGSVVDILETVKDSIPQISKQMGLSLIISKWEIQYLGENVETIDITMKLVQFFSPDESTLKIIEQMKDVEPVKDAFFLND